MPLVLLNRNPELLDDDLTHLLGKMLCEAVAKALSIDDDPDGRLTPSDIEVVVRDVRPGVDINYVTLAIIIFANDFPSRKANLDERREKIEAAIRDYFKTGPSSLARLGRELSMAKQMFVWIRLAPASFGFV